MSHKAHMASSHAFGREHLHMLNAQVAANMMAAHHQGGNNVLAHHHQQQPQHHQPTNLSIGSNHQEVGFNDSSLGLY